jgi:RNA polymerase sigma-70 factor, ECF subfamily
MSLHTETGSTLRSESITSGRSGAVPSSSFNLLTNSIATSQESGLVGDAMLVAAAQAGEERAFVELCARNRALAFSVIHRVTKNREDTEDILQESMMKAFLHLKDFDGRSGFGTWFVRIGINSALMMLRKRRNRAETSIDETGPDETWLAWQIADRSVDPEEHYAGYEVSMRLKHAICRLPAKLRSVVEQGQMEGHSMKEIASKMGISIPATKSRIARAKASLRKSMANKSSGPGVRVTG